MIYVVELFSTVAATMQLAIARNGMFSLHIWIFWRDNFPNARKENTVFHLSPPKKPKPTRRNDYCYYYEFMFAPEIWNSLFIIQHDENNGFENIFYSGIRPFIDVISTERKNWRDLFSNHSWQKRFLEKKNSQCQPSEKKKIPKWFLIISLFHNSWFLCSILTFFALSHFLCPSSSYMMKSAHITELCVHWRARTKNNRMYRLQTVKGTWWNENGKLKFILKMLWQLQVINYPQTWSSNGWRWHRQIQRINRNNIKKAELFHLMVFIFHFPYCAKH